MSKAIFNPEMMLTQRTSPSLRRALAIFLTRFSLLAAVGDVATVKKICESFLKRADETKGKLGTSYESKDFVELRRHAHSLKGSCGYVCSEQLKASVLRLQLACDAINGGKADDADDPGECLQVVLTEFALVKTAIEEHLATLG